jgi:hypothetical protein
MGGIDFPYPPYRQGEEEWNAQPVSETVSDGRARCCAVARMTAVYRGAQCEHPGRYEEGGHWWCGTHRPSAALAKAADRERKYKRKQEGRALDIRQRKAERDLRYLLFRMDMIWKAGISLKPNSEEAFEVRRLMGELE